MHKILTQCLSCMRAKLLQSCPTLTLWTVAHQAPLSMGFSRQEYWSGLPCPPPGDLPDPGTEPCILFCLLHWQVGSFLLVSPGKPNASNKYKRRYQTLSWNVTVTLESMRANPLLGIPKLGRTGRSQREDPCSGTQLAQAQPWNRLSVNIRLA